MELFAFFIFWMLAALGIGYLANQRGRSEAGFILLSIFFSPILALIVLLVLPNLVLQQQQDYQRQRDHEAHLASIKAISSKPETVVVTPPPTQSSASVADEIRKLGELREAGLLSDEEFSAQKKKLLA